MSMFLVIRDDSSKCVRAFNGFEHSYVSENSGTTRYARLVIDRDSGKVAVWTYPYPVKKQIDEALKLARLEPYDCDMRVKVSGAGKDRRYAVTALPESMFSTKDQEEIDKCKIDLRKVCK